MVLGMVGSGAQFKKSAPPRDRSKRPPPAYVHNYEGWGPDGILPFQPWPIVSWGAVVGNLNVWWNSLSGFEAATIIIGAVGVVINFTLFIFAFQFFSLRVR